MNQFIQPKLTLQLSSMDWIVGRNETRRLADAGLTNVLAHVLPAYGTGMAEPIPSRYSTLLEMPMAILMTTEQFNKFYRDTALAKQLYPVLAEKPAPVDLSAALAADDDEEPLREMVRRHPYLADKLNKLGY